MLQINTLDTLEESLLPILDTTKRLWNHLRQQVDKQGLDDSAVVIVTVTYASRRFMTSLVWLRPEKIKAAREIQSLGRRVYQVNREAGTVVLDSSCYAATQVPDRVGDCIKCVR